MFCINIYEQFSAKTQMSALTNVLHFVQKLTLCHKPGENIFKSSNITFLPLSVCQGQVLNDDLNFAFAVEAPFNTDVH